MDSLPGTQITDEMMLNPWMFDPTQQSNQFSNFNNAALPWPPSYNPGNAGGPVNAATGQPIASYQQWAQQHPAGMTLNATPAQPQANPGQWAVNNAMTNATAAGLTPASGGGFSNPNAGGIMGNILQARQQNNAAYGVTQGANGQLMMNGQAITPQGLPALPANAGSMTGAQLAAQGYGQPIGAASQGAQGASGAPNNWQAAINALAQPGKVTTPGATVPMATGSQPAGGVNQAWLQQAQGQPGMNQRFISALGALQNRPQL